MKINKFGSIYMVGDELFIDGFAFGEHEKVFTFKELQLACIEAIHAFMKLKVEENYQVGDIVLSIQPTDAVDNKE